MRSFAALLAALAFAAAPALADEPIVIKFSHVVAESTPKGRAALRFKELAEERTKGRVKVEVYPNSTLYKDGEEMSALQLGSVQMLAPSISKFGPLGVNAFEAFDLPYIFPNRDVLNRVINGPVGKDLLGRLEKYGITGLAYWDNGFKVMSANKPLHLPADFRGLKMRIKSSKVLEAQFRALGAVPQVMAFSEVYQAMQTGVVDGSENSLPNLWTQKFFEVQKYVALSDHGYDCYAVIVNTKFWNGLPADIRATLEQAMKDATAYQFELSAREQDDDLAKIKAANRAQVYDLTDAEKAAWRAALLPVHKQMEARIGKDVIDAIYREYAAAGVKQ
ncbi:MAG TPA: TRAP transporter substrate-binding protein [Usitatibacter sp.]|nr:TRAP transporter substrate-binding protein [Usitatibacter sp.]